jgi:hypothetical protein
MSHVHPAVEAANGPASIRDVARCRARLHAIDYLATSAVQSYSPAIISALVSVVKLVL